MYFLIHQKKRVTFVGYLWNNQGIFLYSIFPKHYFGIFPRTSLGFFSEYTGNISKECSTNIPRTYICPVGVGLLRKVTTFVKSSMFDVWPGSISLQFLKNLKLNKLINIDYQPKSNSLTEGYALSINMDPKQGFVKRAANFSTERTLCIGPYRINYVYEKMELQGNIAYLWENKIIMILEHL